MNKTSPIQVMIVDDHLMVRDGLRMFLSIYDDIKVVAEVDNGQQAVILCEEVMPDVILMDLLMPKMDGIEATRLIRGKYSSIEVIALTSFAEQELVEKAFQAGAISYLLKDVHSDKLAETIREAHQGRAMIDSAAAQALVASANDPSPPKEQLTKREQEVLVFLVGGKTNKEIADTLFLGEGTVRFHVSNILSKLGVNNRTEAASQALQLGLVQPD